jgi:hypothetical protein
LLLNTSFRQLSLWGPHQICQPRKRRERVRTSNVATPSSKFRNNSTPRCTRIRVRVVTVTPPLWIPGPRRIRPPQANWRRHGPEPANKPECTCNATQPNQRESNATQRNPCLLRPACQRQTMQSHESIQRAARTMQPYQGPTNAQLASLHAECDLLGQVATAAFGGLLCAQPQHG